MMLQYSVGAFSIGRPDKFIAGFTALDSESYRLVEQTVALRRISKQHPLTLYGQPDVTAPVSRLFFSCGPSAVLRAIGPVVVDAFQGKARLVPRRLRPRRELGKISPFFADFDASPAVVLVTTMVWRFAAAMHPPPSREQWRFRDTITPSAKAASAIPRASLNERRCPCGPLLAAIASAQPTSVALMSR